MSLPHSRFHLCSARIARPPIHCPALLMLRRMLIAPLVLFAMLALSGLANAAAVFELDGTFYVVPGNQVDPKFVGKYCGTANLVSAVQNGERKIMIDIKSNGSVVVTGEDQSVPGNLSGNTVSASFPIDTSGCTGNFSLSGKIVGSVISGPVSGNISCFGGAFTGPVTGTFSTTRTSASSCPGL